MSQYKKLLNHVAKEVIEPSTQLDLNSNQEPYLMGSTSSPKISNTLLFGSDITTSQLYVHLESFDYSQSLSIQQTLMSTKVYVKTLKTKGRKRK